MTALELLVFSCRVGVLGGMYRGSISWEDGPRVLARITELEEQGDCDSELWDSLLGADRAARIRALAVAA